MTRVGGRSRCSHGCALLVLAASLSCGLGLGLTGCGVPVSASPQPLSAGLLPKALSESLPTLPPPKPLSARDVPVPIYLVNPLQRLVIEARIVAKPLTAQSVLDVLEQGPLPHESQAGLFTALLPGSHLSVLAVAHGVAKVQLDNNFFELVGESAVLELAQIVDTLTKALPQKVKSVQFYFDDVPTEAEIGNGSLVARPVTPKDYASLVQQS